MTPMVEKYALLDALGELRDEALEAFCEGKVSGDRTLETLVLLYTMEQRVNSLTVHLDLTKDLVPSLDSGEYTP